MRVEISVDLKAEHGRRLYAPRQSAPMPCSRSEKQLYWLALALHIENLIIFGEMENYADIARRCGISRARLSRIVAPLDIH